MALVDRRYGSGDFEEFEVSRIYCPGCRLAMPVRKRLMLVLLDREIYHYVCARCGASLGRKEESPAGASGGVVLV
jgi:DNA-directed RNA polymerase subunit RPC12/RpoP